MNISKLHLSKHALVPLVGSIAALLSTTHAHASTVSWKADAGYYNYWNTAGNWVGSVIPDGADTTVDFTGVHIGTDRTLTLDTTSRTVGNLIFGDKNNQFNWTFVSSGGAVLTLATTTGTAPTITVNDSTRTTDIQLSLAGNNGLTKDGAGQLNLSGSNSYTGLTTVSAGWLKLNSSTGKTLPSTNSITVSGGTLSLGYSQTLAGIYLTSGNIVGTTLTSNSIVFESGSVSAPLAGSGGLTKQTSGTVTLSGNNTFTGTTRVTAGTLALGHVTAGPQRRGHRAGDVYAFRLQYLLR